MIKCFSLIFIFFCSLNLFAMNYCIEVCNDTDQPFKIITVNSEQKKTLFEGTWISSVWYGAKKIENEEEIPANTKKRLFITLNQDEHKSESDFFVLENHQDSFYVNFGKQSDNCKISLPVLSNELSKEIFSRYPGFENDEVVSKFNIYKAERISSRKEGAEIIKITKAQ